MNRTCDPPLSTCTGSFGPRPTPWRRLLAAVLCFLIALNLLLTPGASAGPILYEGFQYDPGGAAGRTLNGEDGSQPGETNGTGFDGPWRSSSNQAENADFSHIRSIGPTNPTGSSPLSFGSLTVAGASASNNNPAGFRARADRSLAESGARTAGMADGGELWMSLLYDDRRSDAQPIHVGLTSDSFSLGPELLSGSGVGVRLFQGNLPTLPPAATGFSAIGEFTTAGFNGSGDRHAFFQDNHTFLLVAQFLWNSDSSQNDQMNLWVFEDAGGPFALNLAQPHAQTSSLAVDQTQFNRLAIYQQGPDSVLDEIRFFGIESSETTVDAVSAVTPGLSVRVIVPEPSSFLLHILWILAISVKRQQSAER